MALDNAVMEGLVEEAERVFDRPPRYHAFRTARRPYVYDTNTGRILSTDSLGLSLLEALGKPGFSRFAQDKAREVGDDKVCVALEKILGLATDHDPRLLSTEAPEIGRYCSNHDAYRHALDAKLEQLCVVPTNACDLDCHYCIYSGKHKNRTGHTTETMTRNTLESALAYFVAHTAETELPAFGFYGGEPTLVFDQIKHATSYLGREMGNRKFNMTLNTNLVNVTDEMIDFFVEHGTNLFISLDGPKHVHDRYRVFPDGSGTSSLVMDNLRRIRDRDAVYYERHVSFLATLAPPVWSHDVIPVGTTWAGGPCLDTRNASNQPCV